MRRVRGLGIAALLIGYPLLAHYTNSSPDRGGLGAAVAIAPVLLFALMLAWRSPRRFAMLGGLLLSCLALRAEWSALEAHYGMVYWLQDVGMLLVLLMTFGGTLLGGRQPLCTRFAEALHGTLTPEHELYARRVTWAWTLFFTAMVLASTLLFFFAPLATWSVFANFLTLPLIAAMLIVEHWVRRAVLPDIRPTHLLDALRAFRNASARAG